MRATAMSARLCRFSALLFIVAFRAQSEVGAPPLAFDQWSGPYKNAAGQRWIEQINEWHRQGVSAGLSQDVFRSFDNGHSSLRREFYPQMRFEPPAESFGGHYRNVFPFHVTFGVRSVGIQGRSFIDYAMREHVRDFYKTDTFNPIIHGLFQSFYDNNFLFIAPAVYSFSDKGDRFMFLTPFYLHSVGASGTDAQLMKPLLFAAAAMPLQVKTRALESRLYVPTLMYLFKSNIAGDLKSPRAHLPAYSLPAEAEDDSPGPSPFLDGLISAARGLQHIPPVCRIAFESVRVEVTGAPSYGDRAYFERTPYSFAGVLREGQVFDIRLNLAGSFTDHQMPIRHYYAAALRGDASVEKLDESGSRIRVRVPWTLPDPERDFRTDVLLLVNDGTYFSAPAYISVCHLHRLDPITRGLRAE